MFASAWRIAVTVGLFITRLNAVSVFSDTEVEGTVSLPKEVYDVCVACLQQDNSRTNASERNMCETDADRFSNIEAKFLAYEEDRQQLFQYFNAVTNVINRLMTLEKEFLNCKEMSKLISDVKMLQQEVGKIASLDFSNFTAQKGEKGSKGDIGNSGDKGDMGLEGIPGFPGDAGVRGVKGDPGQPGVNGRNGFVGLKGEKGLQGFPGIPGNDGAKGREGPKGEKGKRGIPGYKGERGSKGEQGIKGQKGEYPCLYYVVLSLLHGNRTLFSASSIYQHTNRHGSDRAVLNSPTTDGAATFGGGWSAQLLDQNQYLQIDMVVPRMTMGVATQGRNSSAVDQWVTEYQVLYSIDCETWNNAVGRNGKVFDGNTDQNTIKDNMFETPVVARCIRINPIEWHNHISMRADVIGCSLSPDEV